jgi:hypothetical protein
MLDRSTTVYILGVLLIGGCEPDRDAGPSEPFEGDARPRNPDHFIVGNGSEPPTPYEIVRSLAISTGTPGMIGYELEDWLRPEGLVRVEPTAGGATHYRFELRGLVPKGFYTAWLVRVRGSSRGDKRDLALGEPYGGPPVTDLGSNAIVADEVGHAVHDVTLDPLFFDPVGTTYGEHELWDEIHVAFHADNRAYGFVPGPNHWTQVVLPIRPSETSLLEALRPTEAPASLDALLATAEAAGVIDATSYDAARWGGARGRVVVDQVDLGTTVEIDVTVTADGLVPGGTYSAWLTRASDGVFCPLGDVTSGVPALFGNQLVVGSDGRGSARAILTPDSMCAAARRLDAVAEWDAVEVWFHPTNATSGLSLGDRVVALHAALPNR